MPKPLAPAVREQLAEESRQKLFADQEAVTRPLSLYDATARAIKYNVDYRVKLMDQAVAAGQFDLSQFDLLPRLTMSAGYTSRNNDSFGFGFSPGGSIATNPSASQERSHTTGSLGFAWNVLDFGVSYLHAKQLADQSLVTEERRRKAVQNLVQDVRLAWWRADAAQRLLPQMDQLLEEIDQAEARARLIENRKLLPPLQTVAFRRSLLDLEQQLSLRRQELAQAHIELGSMMNLPPGTEYQLASPDRENVEAQDLASSIESLEALALRNRPELQEEAYKSRITDLEARKALLSVLPSVGLDTTRNYDNNRYLVNSLWTSAGMNVAFNMMKAFSLPAMDRSAAAQKKADEARRLAVAMAVLTQTRVAAVRYTLLAHEYGVWHDAVEDDARIVKYLASAKDVGLETELELIRARARALISTVQRDLTYANLESVIGRLYNSIGLDSLPRESESHATSALAQELQKKIGEWQAQTFAPKQVPDMGALSLVPVTGIPREATEPFQAALQRVLRLSRISVESEGSARFRLVTAIVLDPPQDSGRPAIMSIRMYETNNPKPVFETEQRSMLSEPISLEQWLALAEGAGYAVSEPMRRLSSKQAKAKQGSGGANLPLLALPRSNSLGDTRRETTRETTLETAAVAQREPPYFFKMAHSLRSGEDAGRNVATSRARDAATVIENRDEPSALKLAGTLRMPEPNTVARNLERGIGSVDAERK